MLNLFIIKCEFFFVITLTQVLKNDSAANNSDVLNCTFLEAIYILHIPNTYKGGIQGKNTNFEKTGTFISKMGIF